MSEYAQRILSPVDYVVFAGMLLISVLIGIFFAYRDRRANHGTAGYLMANRSMGVVPVAISIAVSFKSAVTVLGIPADVYQFGLWYTWTLVGFLLACIVVSLVFIPTLYGLGITSTYEYLERRFSKSVRLTTTGLYLIQTLLYLGINIYAPALALSEVTDFTLVAAMLSTGIVCVFYTTLGGFKAVIWTDVFQGLIIVIGMLAFITKGSMYVGGFDKVWKIAHEGGRTDILSFETDPRIRYTFWSVCVGTSVLWVGILGTNQAQVQRLLSVKSQKNSIKALCLGCFGIGLVSSLSIICGTVMYAYYCDCDPLADKCIRTRDQLLPYAAMDLFRNTPGLTGVILSCAFSASLSTLSSGINSMITVTIEDFIKPHTDWTERRYTWVSKGLGILFGAAALGISFLASVLGDIVTIAIASMSAFIGPLLGLFLLGIWFPFVNAIGGATGFITGNVFGMILFFGGRSIKDKKPNYFMRKLEVSTRFCPADCGYMDSINITAIEAAALPHEIMESGSGVFSSQTDAELSSIENLFAISYMYTACVTCATTLIVGVIVSLLSCGWKHRHKVDHRLIRPPFESRLFSWLPDKIRSPLRFGVSWKDHQKVEWDKEKENFEIKTLHDGLQN